MDHTRYYVVPVGLSHILSPLLFLGHMHIVLEHSEFEIHVILDTVIEELQLVKLKDLSVVVLLTILIIDFFELRE